MTPSKLVATSGVDTAENAPRKGSDNVPSRGPQWSISIEDHESRAFSSQVLDRVDPNLQRNTELVGILVEWEEAWEIAVPYVRSSALQKSLEAFISDVLRVADRCPEFKEACLCSDVDLAVD